MVNLLTKDLHLIVWRKGVERHSQPSQDVEEGGVLPVMGLSNRMELLAAMEKGISERIKDKK